MSDLDTLIVTFQRQLSDVMEAVVKTAMFEVTRLVEDVFMMEVRRSKLEVDSLRLQLQWTGSKHGGDAERTDGSVELESNEADQSPVLVKAKAEEHGKNIQEEFQSRLWVTLCYINVLRFPFIADTMSDCELKNPDDAEEHWLSNGREESKIGSADNPEPIQSPGRESKVSHMTVWRLAAFL